MSNPTPLFALSARVADLAGIDDADDLDHAIGYTAAEVDRVSQVVITAALSLIDTHRSRNIDLTQAPDWLALVRLVYPRAEFEGTGETGPGILHTATETGRYRLVAG